MNWTRKYWDTLEQLYWTPKYLGLKSIPKRIWGDDEKVIQLPRNRVSQRGSIYTRDGNWLSNDRKMRGLEETLNHIFDLTFAITPDAVTSTLLHQKAEIEDEGPFESVGREIGERYGWGGANVTQQDGLFVSASSILNVELKLGSKTQPVQVLKYLMITLQEEKLEGRRPNIALLYVTPHTTAEVMKQAGADENGQLPKGFVREFDPAKLNATARAMVKSDLSALEDVATRIRLFHISWSELAANCEAMIGNLDQRQIGDQTLVRLLSGFAGAIKAHRGTV